ncbi:uroporphyrinogen-III synthase [Roseateles saccharophilus]|uniref:Uroporphyrinogen-III synthase n=1 Tax=Roseateles saccharophilus TaxID=304 RepID=A0A4R3ULW0_ROSSA|nr:uroporphyrinogen-III synthase [Roseateles saccharophilus]MDG0835515.1 uroporphyrinogen-III synthase [Roseateles saccharophilus]TCU92676.1 uroporphyrinogen-III synthase [Roseateles saccharophilus]
MTAPTLLVTRPRPQCAAWLARLAALGVKAAALPLIEILPAHDPAPLRAAWAVLPAVDLAVFVSPNAVEHFFAQAGGMTWPPRTLAACVGPGSAQALAARGVPAASIVQPAADAASLDSEHLWEQLAPRRDWAGARVLLLRGDGGREWLAERLAGAGARVEAVAVYHRAGPCLNAAEQALLGAAQADPAGFAWLFSSAEAVGHLQGLWGGAPAGQRAIATHPRIAEAARAAGFGPVVLARPDPEAVTRALKGV